MPESWNRPEITVILDPASLALADGAGRSSRVSLRAQLPPTFRGVRIRGTKPRAVVVFHGCSVRGFTGRVGVGLADAAGVVDASADALSRAATSLVWSFSRQQCLYLRPEPQWQGSLRPGRELVGGVI